MSGIGKGVANASLGKILQSQGFKVTSIKIDPYINVDAGTMNPIEHGEVFVTTDGSECDQDIGNYERFLNQNLYSKNYITTGRVYQTVINRERNLGYQGKCVEVVPDIPNEVISIIKNVAESKKADFVLIEIGGTVGEYQNVLFLEAARIMKLQQPDKVMFVLISYLPVPSKIGEMKTKPTQYAVRTLNSSGIQPNIIIARSEYSVDEPRKRKISTNCNLNKENIISAPDVDSIYKIPLNFEEEKLSSKILNNFGLKAQKKDLKKWKEIINNIKHPTKKVRIAIAGKYFSTGNFSLTDSYISVIEAIKHASFSQKIEAEINWFDTEKYEFLFRSTQQNPSSFASLKNEKDPQSLEELKEFDGVIIPGGFGQRGIEGKIKTIEFCRNNNIPFLGLCLGMQLSVIEFARNVCGLKNANSTEFVENEEKLTYPVIDIMQSQKENIEKGRYGGTMRLGSYKCILQPNTISSMSYKKAEIFERHRHRYELNNEFRETLKQNGMIMSGINPEMGLVEIVELSQKKHPFYVGVQFHPEFKSRPIRPSPIFKKFIKSAAHEAQK